MSNAAADGSTLMRTPSAVTVPAPMVFSKLPHDPAADFAPVAHVANLQFALSVNASRPAPGSLPHFFSVMIARGAGLDLVPVPYNGGGR